MFAARLKLDVRGASHARALRFALSNFPAGVRIDAAALAAFMERRAPGRDRLSTQRRESDAVAFLSGVEGGVTTGGTIRGVIENRDMRPGDYGAERTVPRPGHADFGQWVTEGRIPTGGGRNSGRLTAPLCAAGGLCKQFLQARGIEVSARLASVGDATEEPAMLAAIEKARAAGDSVGGTVRCTVLRPPVGLGGALFDGLESALSAALFAIPGVKGVAFGERPRGFGSSYNDAFAVDGGEVVTETNRHGGLLGGRTSGMPVEFEVAFKPTPTVYVEQRSVDLATMKAARLSMKGRHDPCIVRRAVPAVEAAAALVLADAILADEAAHPRICLTLTAKTLEGAVQQYRGERYFADMVELRVDLLDAKSRERAAEFPEMLRTCGSVPRPVPVVLTYRRKADGGAFAGGEKARIDFFRRALSRGAFAYVDFEDDFRVPELTRLAAERGTRIVRSLHDFTGPVPRLSERMRRMVAGTDEIAKVAFTPRSLDDVSRLFRRRPDGALVIAMGPQGLATRVLAARLGAPWTYASVGGLDGLGHVTPHELVRDYRFRTLTRSAALFGVTGWPLAKTRSPEIHNAAFAAQDEDALMIPFPSRTAREAIRFMRAMDMRGLAVTIPHKVDVMPLLDGVDATARKVGAVNTVIRDGARLRGSNTDRDGFAEAVTAFAGDLRGRRVAVLGDGGAAQAVKAALRKLGADYRVFHRETPPEGVYEVLVNATPVDPIPDYAFSGKERVYDLGYVPGVTPLMARAARAGCKVENGLRMLVLQARLQRELWYNVRR